MSNRKKQRYHVPSLCAFAIFACATATYGQESQAPESADSRGRIIEEMIVTAQRREERLEDVPLSIATASAEKLERLGVSEIRDLSIMTPSLRFHGVGVWSQPAIRGISASAVNPGAESNIAIYVDGVYQPVQLANVFELPDVSRVEVIKGPVGTLFGRNATGGAIRIFTQDPTDTASGKLTASYGRFNDVLIKGYAAGPLFGDAVTGSLAAFYQDRDGYYDDILTGDDIGDLESKYIRGKVKFFLSEKVRLKLTGYVSDRDDNGALLEFPLEGNTLARLLDPAAVYPSKRFDIGQDEPSFLDVETRGADAQLDVSTSMGDITSSVSYVQRKVRINADGDFSSAPIASFFFQLPSDTWTFETIFSSKDFGRWHYVVGGFLYGDDTGFDRNTTAGTVIPGGLILTENDVDRDSAAIFGEVNIDLTERLTLIGGVRYTKEKASYSGSTQVGGVVTVPPGTGADANFDQWTPRISLRYALSESTNLYATYSEGFKSGLFNVAQFAMEPVDSEEVSAYEIGLKSASAALSFNVAAFWYDYKKQQVQLLVGATEESPGSAFLENAASSEIYGAEFDMTYLPTERLSLSGSLGYLHAEYEEYANASVNVPIFVPGLDCPCGNTSTAIDASGQTQPRAPEWSGSLTASYLFPTEFGSVELSGTYFYTSKIYLETGNLIKQPAYEMINARAAWTPHDSNFKVSLWGKNLSDEKVIANSFLIPFGDGVNFYPPRTYGVQVDYEF